MVIACIITGPKAIMKTIYLKASFLGLTLVFLLALLGHSARQLVQQGFSHNVDTTRDRILGFDIDKVWVYAQRQIARQCPEQHEASK